MTIAKATSQAPHPFLPRCVCLAQAPDQSMDAVLVLLHSLKHVINLFNGRPMSPIITLLLSCIGFVAKSINRPPSMEKVLENPET